MSKLNRIIHKASCFLNNQSLKRKLVVSFILIIFIPLSISNSILLNQLSNYILDYKNSNVKSSTEQISYNIEYKLNLYSQITDNAFFNEEINNVIYNKFDSYFEMYETYVKLGNLFYIIKNTNKDVLNISLYNNNPTLIPDRVRVLEITEETRRQEWYREVIKKRWKGYYSNVSLVNSGQYNEQASFMFARPLDFWELSPDPSILVMKINENALYSLIEKEASGKILYIVNDRGDIISSNKREHMSKKYNKIIDTDINALPSGTLYITIGETHYMLVYSTNSYGWKVISLVPLNSLLEIPQDLLFMFILMYLSCFLLSVLLIVFFSKMLTKRLGLFERCVRNIETTNFNIPRQISGEDEVGRISQAFNSLIARLKTYLQEIVEDEAKIRNAEIKSLQSQINPHFLYNTVDTIYWLVLRKKNDKAAKMLLELSLFYKSILSKGDNLISIENELQILKRYLAIEIEKMDVEVCVHYDIHEECLGNKVLKFLLQPFVENILHHAVYFGTNKINIVVKLRVEGAYIHISLIDDGVGISKEKLNEIMNASAESSGYAIFNIKERLKLYYGDQHSLSIFSRPGIGTQVDIRIPKYESFREHV